MVTAMEQANLEPVIIEDLVKFGEDRGYERGRLEGEERGRLEGEERGRLEGEERGRFEGRLEGRLEEERATLRRVLALRKLGLNADGEARINACMDLATLQRWHDQAVLAATADEALQ
jgi:predicted transposase YdaD